MIRTPEMLQEKFGIEAEAGHGRAVPRVLLAYNGPRKKEFLSTTISMIVAGALPEHGQKSVTWRREVTQETLAGMCGLASRATFTRRLTSFRECEGAAVAVAKKFVPLVNRRRRFAAPNLYSFRMPQRLDPESPGRYLSPELADLLADPRTAPYFSLERSGFKKVAGFKDIPRWVWDARLPISDIARLVMSYYFLCGLLDAAEGGHVRGEVHPRQSTVAQALGISVRSVYMANRQLEALGVVRVAHDKPQVKDGRFVRGPAKIIYLPVRQLTRQEADAERERYRAALARLRDDATTLQAAQLHNELLSGWQGKEHRITAFWRELRRRMVAAGLDRQSINLLVPRPPE